MTFASSGLICAAVALLGSLVLVAPGDWLAEPAVRERLAEGQVVVETTGSIDSDAPRGHVRAAVRIPAAPEAIWRVMTDCAQAPLYVPGLRRC
ncbi:MAG: hypothetical protein JOZ89_09660, partial [Gammaproteobacteria bacterium]|nr:hypothetical protein [Gammaproteobacteria bacterium]